MILCREAYAKQIDKAIFPGTQGGPLMHIIAAKAVALGEALTPEFAAYQKNVAQNAQVLANALLAKGLHLVSGGTDNHLMLIDLRGTGLTGKELEKRLDEVHITANKNAIPNDPEKPFVTSGVRLGTPAATTRGLGADDFELIGELIAKAVYDFEGSESYIRDKVASICEKYPLYK